MPRAKKKARPNPAPSVLDRNSPIPAYSQIANLLRGRIAEGQYRPGEAIPTVAELSSLLGVASMTVRQAINQLAEEGVIVREQGRGTFVQAPSAGSAKFTLDPLLERLSDKALAERVLGLREVAATPLVAAKLAIPKGTPVTFIRRILVRDDKPLFYQARYVLTDSHRHLDEIESTPDSMRGLFLGYGEMGIKNGRITLHASVLDRTDAAALQAEPGQAAWVIEYLYFHFDGKPAIWGRVICLAELLNFSAPVGIGEPAITEKSAARSDAA